MGAYGAHAGPYGIPYGPTRAHMTVNLIWFLQRWNVEMLKMLNVEMLKCWKVEMLKCWEIPRLKCWNVEVYSIKTNISTSTFQHFNISTFQLFNIFNISTCWGFQHPMLCKFVQMLTMLSTIHFFQCWMLLSDPKNRKCCQHWNVDRFTMLKCWNVVFQPSTFNISTFRFNIQHSTFNISLYCTKLKVVDEYPRRVAVRRRSVGRRGADGRARIH